jgi:tetratricopeptide (TPR) repeat protein
MVDVRVLDPYAPEHTLPVWLAYGRYYLTGSLSAYARLALDNFNRYPDGPDRDFWANALVNATGILVRMDFDEPWALRARGLVFAETGMPDLGLADLAKASQLLNETDQADADMEAALGHMLLMKEDHLAALPHLRRAVELAPGDAVAWSDLGLALIMTGETEEAEAALTRAIELDPKLATAWYNRGLMHLHAEDFEAAEADLNEAARLAPGNPDMGQLLQQIRRLREQKEHSPP